MKESFYHAHIDAKVADPEAVAKTREMSLPADAHHLMFLSGAAAPMFAYTVKGANLADVVSRSRTISDTLAHRGVHGYVEIEDVEDRVVSGSSVATNLVLQPLGVVVQKKNLPPGTSRQLCSYWDIHITWNNTTVRTQSDDAAIAELTIAGFFPAIASDGRLIFTIQCDDIQKNQIKPLVDRLFMEAHINGVLKYERVVDFWFFGDSSKIFIPPATERVITKSLA